MKLSHLLQGISEKIDNETGIAGLQLDSRLLKAGDLFIACPGLQADGRGYIPEAIAKGAAAVVYEPYEYELPAMHVPIPLVPVPELSRHVSLMAARFYQHPGENMSVIGITGTNGKTSCAQFIAQALQAQQVSCGVVGTLGYGFLPQLQPIKHTTPDAIECQRILSEVQKQGATAVAMEVSSHALVQHRVEAVPFRIGVFTQLSRDHLDYHGDMLRYGQAKELLFQRPGMSYGVINEDDAWGRELIDRHQADLSIIGYSLSNQPYRGIPSILATQITPDANGFAVQVQTPWGEGTFTTSLLGRFNISNLLAVLAVLCLSEVPLAQALLSLSQLRTARGRMEWVSRHNPHQPQVVIDYAHTPDALLKVLLALREHCTARLLCVFGCGGDRDRGKRPEMAAIAEQYADDVILTNDNPRYESPMRIIQDMIAGLKEKKRATILLNREEAIQFAVQKATTNDIVLIAGKGHETTQRVGDTLYPFDDRCVVKEMLGKKT